MPNPSGRSPARSAASRSPPCAPTPEARIHSSGANFPHRGQRLGVRCADHQAQVVPGVPALRQLRHVVEQPLGRSPIGQEQVLQVACTGIRRFAQQEDASLRLSQEGFQAIPAPGKG